MSINLDNLPKEKPESGFTLVPEGYHLAVIEDAEVKPSAAGNPYLSMKLKTMHGVIFDMISESDKPAIQYKLARFITAIGLPMSGSLDLKDLPGLIKGKELVIDVKHEDNTYNGKTTKKAVVDIFEHDIYYPASMYADLVGLAPAPNQTAENPPSTGSY
jgi:hypothetical protein